MLLEVHNLLSATISETASISDKEVAGSFHTIQSVKFMPQEIACWSI
jgi:hypothetical protein